jgi:hypothetical protein
MAAHLTKGTFAIPFFFDSCREGDDLAIAKSAIRDDACGR